MPSSSNPFFSPDWLPHFDAYTPELAEAAFETAYPQAMSELDQLEEALTPSWEDLFVKLHRICAPLQRIWGFSMHLVGVVNTEGWRNLEEKLQPRMIAFSQRVAQSPALFRAYTALQKADSKKKRILTPTQRRVLDATVRDARLAGVGLQGEAKDRFNALQADLAQAAMLFNNNVLDAVKAYTLTLTTPEETAGLPPSLLASLADAARTHGHPEATAEKGPWLLTLDAATYIPFMKYAKNRPLRETLYRAFTTRAATAPFDNTPIIETLLQKRRELAALLGHPTFADVSLARKMAPGITAVEDLLNRLAEASRAPAVKESADLLTFAHKNGFPHSSLLPWDIPYYAERLRETAYDYNEETLRAYFPLDSVLKGLFAFIRRLFEVKIIPAETTHTWHKDVRLFHVTDLRGKLLAGFYFDPYTRPGTKNGGAWVNDFRTRDFETDPATPTLPIAVIVCNQTPPVGDAPATLRFDEVITLFHEMGHALQHMLTAIDTPHASGLNNIEWDAVEIASQFMENWCYDRPTLRSLSHHTQTGAPIPDALFAKLYAARNFRSAHAMLRQLYFALTDLTLHAYYPQPQWKNANDVKLTVATRILIEQPTPEDRFLNAFTHIFSGGYSAGYYSYKWSETLSADVFEAFEEAGLENPRTLLTLGRRYRDTFLALGGSQHPSDVFRAFRGRDPGIEAILHQSGLDPVRAF